MSITHPLGFLALLSIPAIVIIHLYRRKLKERKAAGLFLFVGLIPQNQTGRKRLPFIQSVSFWLEILFALIVTWFLLGVSLFPKSSPKHFIFVLDDSASMSAVFGNQKIVNQAKIELEKKLDSLHEYDEVTFILTGNTPETIVDKNPPTLARKMLSLWNPQKPWHSPKTALELGQNQAEPTSELWFLTDHLQQEDGSVLPTIYEVHSFGQELPNVAIVQAKRFLKEKQENLLLRIAAFSKTGGTIEVSISLAEPMQPFKLWTKKSLVLTPQKSESILLPLPKPGLLIQVDLPADALEIDNHLLLLPEPEKQVKVWNQLQTPQSQALQLEKLLSILNTKKATKPEEAQLIFQEMTAPFSVPSSAIPKTYIFVGNPPAKIHNNTNNKNVGTQDHWKGPYILEQQNPFLKEVKLEGVIWTAGSGKMPGTPLILANEQVLLSEKFDGKNRLLFLNLDPKQSSLARSIDWLIFMKNVIEIAQEQIPGPKNVNVPIGHPLRYQFGEERAKESEFFWKDPLGKSTSTDGEFEAEWLPEQVGRYMLFKKAWNPIELATFSVFFIDENESDLRFGKSGIQASSKRPETNFTKQGPSLWNRLFLFLLLVILFGNWIWLHVRSTH